LGHIQEYKIIEMGSHQITFTFYSNRLHSYRKWPIWFVIWFDDLPIKIVIFHSSVSLPEGKYFWMSSLQKKAETLQVSSPKSCQFCQQKPTENMDFTASLELIS